MKRKKRKKPAAYLVLDLISLTIGAVAILFFSLASSQYNPRPQLLKNKLLVVEIRVDNLVADGVELSYFIRPPASSALFDKDILSLNQKSTLPMAPISITYDQEQPLNRTYWVWHPEEGEYEIGAIYANYSEYCKDESPVNLTFRAYFDDLLEGEAYLSNDTAVTLYHPTEIGAVTIKSAKDLSSFY